MIRVSTTGSLWTLHSIYGVGAASAVLMVAIFGLGVAIVVIVNVITIVVVVWVFVGIVLGFSSTHSVGFCAERVIVSIDLGLLDRIQRS